MRFTPGQRVRSRTDPGRMGMTTNVPPQQRSTEAKWQVRWDNQALSWEYGSALEPVDSETYLDPYELIRAGRYGRAADFRRNLTFVHITGRLANLVYSMGITNTEFFPHQYKPLLTLLESPCSGLLIADEVGLGKTIEAGLIWTEFRARFDKRRLLVVCPAMLREKWQDELRLRFGVKADILSATEMLARLNQPLHSTNADFAWIVSYQSIRPPKQWVADADDADDARNVEKLATFLSRNATEHPLFDMVVFDEAHNMRNQNTGTWQLGSLLRDVTDTQIMLSATPINLRNDDLFSLLNLLDPDHFSRLDDLQQVLRSNIPLVKARDVVLNPQRTAAEFHEALSAASMDPVLGASSQLRRLLDSPPSEIEIRKPAVRAELANALDRMNLLSHVLTRTRKRDVYEKGAIREVHREAVTLSEAEREFYAYVTETIRRYAFENDLSDGFLLATPQRQVSSCPAALLASWRSTAVDDDLGEYALSFEQDDSALKKLQPLKSVLKAKVPIRITVERLEANDSKFKSLIHILDQLFRENPREKIIIFTSFRPTARYLSRRLGERGHPATIVWGNQGKSKHEVIADFRTDSTTRVLVSTEVAAEGVDLQFCRFLVNYDLPWNPTRVEQRIGRIDRLGQQSPSIFIWNLYFADTIDDRVVSRLLNRLQTFESALGETEAVVGEEISKLEYQLLCRPRSPEEEAALVDQIAVRLEQVAKHREELERNAPHMMAHGQQVLERISASKALMRFITARDLLIFVKDTLDRRYPGYQYISEEGEELAGRLQLSPVLCARLEPYLRDRGLIGQTRLVAGRLTNIEFKNAIAGGASTNRETIHQFHPLITFLAKELREGDEAFYPTVALQLERGQALSQLEPGAYAFCIFKWSFTGVFEEEWLASAVAPVGGSFVLEEAISEQLVNAARNGGDDWLTASSELSSEAATAAIERAEDEIEKRFNTIVQRKTAENEDRVRFQLDSIERHMRRRDSVLEGVEVGHETNGRSALAAATRGKRSILARNMEQRRAAVIEGQKVRHSQQMICCGVVNVR